MGLQSSQSEVLIVDIGPLGGEAAQLDISRERVGGEWRATPPRDGRGCCLDKPINVTVTQAAHV